MTMTRTLTAIGLAAGLFAVPAIAEDGTGLEYENNPATTPELTEESDLEAGTTADADGDMVEPDQASEYENNPATTRDYTDDEVAADEDPVIVDEDGEFNADVSADADAQDEEVHQDAADSALENNPATTRDYEEEGEG